MDIDRKIVFLNKTVTELQSRLSQKELSKLFSSTGMQLTDILVRLQNHLVRIAIVGVTSSGKSTFLNTVLGHKFLPTGVPPSSGRQIVCRKDKHNHTYAEIIFTPESGKKTLKAATNIPNFVSHYGDERENPGNVKQVLEIRCHTGFWRLPENYVLIDTPGLAAYGHEEHEAITLQLVVPTVDAVIYLTTATCQSDARTLEYIDNVTAQDKPLIVVQNKIDTIEEKLYRDVSKIKTKEQIRHEHFERVRSMLQKAVKPSVRNAPIVQITAKSWESVSHLLEVLKEQIRSNENCRTWRFANQLKNIILDLQQQIEFLLAGNQEKKVKNAQMQKRISHLTQQRDQLESALNSSMLELRKKVSLSGSMAGAIIQSVCNVYSLPLPRGFTRDPSFRQISFSASRQNIPPELKNSKSKLERDLKDLPAALNKKFKAVTEKLNALAAELNIQEEQLYEKTFPVTSRNTIISDAVDFKTVHHAARRVAQDGFWGGLKRFCTFGICGYDDIPAWDEQQQFFSPEQFLRNVQKTANDNIPFMENALTGFLKNMQSALSILDPKLQQMTDELSGLSADGQETLPEKELLDIQKYVKDIICALNAEFGGEIPVNNVRPEERSLPDTTRKVSCDPLTYKLFRFATDMSFSFNSQWMKMLCAKLDLRHANVQVFFWNTAEKDKFNINFGSDADRLLSVDYVDAARGISGIRESRKYDFRIALMDLGEVGYFERLFVESGVQDYLKKHTDIPIVWCMNSAKSLQDNLIEAFAEQIRLTRSVLGSKRPFCFMSNDRDIYYSALLYGLYFDLPETVTEEGLRDFIARYIKTFHFTQNSPMREHLAASLKNYIELKYKHGGRNG